MIDAELLTACRALRDALTQRNLNTREAEIQAAWEQANLAIANAKGDDDAD